MVCQSFSGMGAKREMLYKKSEKSERSCCWLGQTRPEQCTAALPGPTLGRRLAAGWLADDCLPCCRRVYESRVI